MPSLRALALALVMLLTAFGLSGCWTGPELPEDFGQCSVSADLESASGSAIERPTYHRDVRPILEANCTSCHADGGIGPFSLTSYASAQAFGELSLAAIDAGLMPPSPPSSCCAPLRDHRELAAADAAVIERWLDQGAPEGDPADAPAPQAPPGLSRVDVEVQMPEPYTPAATIGASDDQRCFLLDWPVGGELDAVTNVTGIEVVPGRRELVHHAILYAIPEGQVGFYEGKDARSDGPGWSCPGGVLQGADAWIGSWVPGAGAIEYPEGLGHRIEPNTRLLLSVHYELSAGAAADQTTVRLRLDEQVETQIEGLAVMNPTWLIGKSMMIPAGESDAEFGYAYDPAGWFNLGRSIQVHSVSLHMHEFGTRGSLAILRGDGSVDCLLHIEDWDFNWQGEYFLAEPVTLEFGDRLYVECHFDNSAGHQLDGAEPEDLWWGDDKEMCLGSVTISK